MDEKKFVCGICGKEYDNIADRCACEMACVKKEKQKKLEELKEIERKIKAGRAKEAEAKKKKREEEKKAEYDECMKLYDEANKKYDAWLDKYCQNMDDVGHVLTDLIDRIFG